MSYIKPREWTTLPFRTCRTMHECVVCKDKIRVGEGYYDGGIRRRAHVACVITSQPKEPTPSNHMSKYHHRSYHDLKTELQNIPLTWYPDLLRVMIQASIAKGCWLPGGASAFVTNIEAHTPIPAVNTVRNAPINSPDDNDEYP